jgi:uncharacterized membrane protein (TIGR02234 family)
VKHYRAFGLALLLDLLGAGGVLLASVREWQTLRAARPAPLRDVVLGVSGRTVDAAPTALAVVALAGVVAVLATRGIARRAVGGVLAVAGVVLAVRAVLAAGAVGDGRARSLLAAHRRSVDVTGLHASVTTHAVWPALTVVGALLIVAGGGLVAWRGAQWQAMSRRYEAPDPEQESARTATTMWTALDRGHDPTE